jgi:hypothetical protein
MLADACSSNPQSLGVMADVVLHEGGDEIVAVVIALVAA